jgi:rod shape determining protein RodA
VQPSEFVKLAVIILIARYFSRDETGARKGQYGLVDLWRPFLIVLVPVALVMKQPDLGTALVTFFIAFTMIVFAKVRWRDLIVLAAGGAAASVFAWRRLLKPYQKSRLLTFLNPEAYAKSTGYHAIQSVIAVGSGQWSGKGWGEGTQNQLSFLPEQHTDFIFAVVGEELGFIGVTIALTLFLFLLLRAVRIASNANDSFSSLVALGLASSWLVHVVVNVGMTLNLMPITGIPLPFFSYGGSFLLACWVSIGFLMRISSEGRGGRIGDLAI